MPDPWEGVFKVIILILYVCFAIYNFVTLPKQVEYYLNKFPKTASGRVPKVPVWVMLLFIPYLVVLLFLGAFFEAVFNTDWGLPIAFIFGTAVFIYVVRFLYVKGKR